MGSSEFQGVDGRLQFTTPMQSNHVPKGILNYSGCKSMYWANNEMESSIHAPKTVYSLLCGLNRCMKENKPKSFDLKSTEATAKRRQRNVII